MATEKPKRRLDAAGWLVWFVVWLILLGPSIYLLGLAKLVGTKWAAIVLFGVVVASIGAGFITWILNWFLQRREARRRANERTAQKKANRRKKR